MKRFAATAAVVIVATCAALASSAYAAPHNTTSITLSCDKNVDATVSLTLQPAATDRSSLGDVTISCGPTLGRQRNRVEVPTGNAAAEWVTITSWINSTGTAPNICATSESLSYRGSCTNDAGTGSQLTVR